MLGRVLTVSVIALSIVVSGQSMAKKETPAKKDDPKAKKPAAPAAVSQPHGDKDDEPPSKLVFKRPARKGVRRGATRTTNFAGMAAAFARSIAKFEFPPKRLSYDDAAAKAMSFQTDKKKLADAPVDYLARIVYVLEADPRGSKSVADAFRKNLNPYEVMHGGAKVDMYPDIVERVADFHERYDVPCREKVVRKGDAWPPHFECPSKQVVATTEPLAAVAFKHHKLVGAKALGPADQSEDESKEFLDPKAGPARASKLSALDKGDGFPNDNFGNPPTKFCVKQASGGESCLGSYAAVMKALYGASASRTDGFPVFCAPAKKSGLPAPKAQAPEDDPNSPTYKEPTEEEIEKRAEADLGEWDTSKVICSTQWTDTLGEWVPWKESGDASLAPKRNTIPPFTCFGDPRLSDYALLHDGGKANGFVCRRRVFRVLAVKAPKNEADAAENRALMCQEMREQTWAEKYKNIVAEYSEWCNKKPDRVASGLCPKPFPKGDDGKPVVPALPFMLLSREELLYFFAHSDHYCRADRKGLTHFLYNKKWARTFTCGVPRGVIEGGPFEEGVQACAIAPYVGENPGTIPPSQDPKIKKIKPAPAWFGGTGLDKTSRLARLHCWKFDRPTCEELSKEPENVADRKHSVWRSLVFDVFDTIKHYRRTADWEVFNLIDPKDVEKRVSWHDRIGFPDTAKDEGNFGIKEFCRVEGGSDLNNAKTTRVRCGQTRESIAAWYELRKHEEPEGCGTGVCVRGAYERGYFCRPMWSNEFFVPIDPKTKKRIEDPATGRPLPPKKFWVCGIDTGQAGRAVVKDANAICVGGKIVEKYQSAKGDKNSLQCYGRHFRWGDSQESEDILARLDWVEIVKRAAVAVASNPEFYDDWLEAEPVIRENWHDKKEDQNEKKQARAETHRERIREYSEWMAKNLAARNWEYFTIYVKKLGEETDAFAAFQKSWSATRRETNKDYQRFLSYLRGPARRKFNDLWNQEKPHLFSWAAKNGHALGHMASLAKLLMQSDIPAIKEFKKLEGKFNVLAQKSLSYKPLGYSGKMEAVTNDPDEGDFKVRDKTLAGELSGLIKSVVTGERYADDKWYEEFRKAATDGNLLRIYPTELATALIVSNFFEVLDIARRQVKAIAKKYADSVFNKARLGDAQWLSRVEILEEAREEPMAKRLKGGNVFCVAGGVVMPKDGKQTYVCASSPLLVAGRTDHIAALADAQRRKEKKDASDSDGVPPQIGWCFGGLRGEPVFGLAGPANPTNVLNPASNLDSPYELEVPPSLVEKAKKREVYASHWLRCGSFQYFDQNWGDAPRPPRVKTGSGVASGGKAPNAKDKKVKDAADRIKSNDPDHEITADDKEDAMDKAGDLIKQAGGFIMDVLSAAAPDLKEELEKIRGIAQETYDFLQKWSGKIIAALKLVWPEAAKKLETFKSDTLGKLEKVRGEKQAASFKMMEEKADWVDGLHGAFRDAEKAAAGVGVPPSVIQKATEAKKKYEDAKATVTNLKKDFAKELQVAEEALKKAQSGDGAGTLKKLMGDIRKENSEMKGSGDFVGPMLDDLYKLLQQKLNAFVKSLVDMLLEMGFGLIKTPLGIGLNAAIAAVGSIPFVGGALAAICAVVFDMLIDLLRSAIGDAITGVVSNALGALVRVIGNPIFKAIKEKIVTMAKAACSEFGDICPRDAPLKFSALPPKDRWIDRATACVPPPIIDDHDLRGAAIARARLERRGEWLEQNGGAIGIAIANRVLKKFGTTYESFMAEAANPTPRFRAKVAKIESGIREMGVKALVPSWQSPSRRVSTAAR